MDIDRDVWIDRNDSRTAWKKFFGVCHINQHWWSILAENHDTSFPPLKIPTRPLSRIKELEEELQHYAIKPWTGLQLWPLRSCLLALHQLYKGHSQRQKAQEEEPQHYSIKLWPGLQLQPLQLCLPVSHQPYVPAVSMDQPLLDLHFTKPSHDDR